MSISKRVYALANLGVQTAVHYITFPFIPKKSKGLDRFIANYSNDRMTFLTGAELKALPSFENCINCKACDLACHLYEKYGEARFPGPSFLPLAASRSMPDFSFTADYLKILGECGGCEDCSSVCPQNVDFRLLREFVGAHIKKLAALSPNAPAA